MGGNLQRLVVGLVLAGGAVLLGPVAGEAGSGDVTCTGTQSTNVLHNLIVPANTSCTIAPDTVIGNDVIVGAGATLISNGAIIAHDIKANGAAFIQLEGGGKFAPTRQDEQAVGTVGNDVLLIGINGTGNSPGGDPNFVCNLQIGHNLVIQNSTSTAGWVVGDIGPGTNQNYYCADPNTVGNDLTVRGNSDPVDVSDNSVGHNLTVTNNTGGTTVNNNTVGTDAKCSGNTGFSGSGNTAGHVNTCNGGI